MQETCILALGQVGRYLHADLHKSHFADGDRITKDEELNIVLLGLVGYLGHSNPIVSGAAFNEVSYRLSENVLG